MKNESRSIERMRQLLPEGASTVPGWAVAYWFERPDTLHVLRFRETGRTSCYSYKLRPGQIEQEIRVRKQVFRFNRPAWALYDPAISQCPPPAQTTALLLARFEALTRAVEVAESQYPPRGIDRRLGDNARYTRKKAQALLRHMPRHFRVMPNDVRTAYRLEPLEEPDTYRLTLAKVRTGYDNTERDTPGAVRYTEELLKAPLYEHHGQLLRAQPGADGVVFMTTGKKIGVA